MTASMDSSRALVDTNIVVYAYDLDDSTKHTIARELLEQLSNEADSSSAHRCSTSFAR
jgi:predicted nucleic acid-binding protein